MSDYTSSPVRTVAVIVGVTFLAVGVLGFIPGITTNYADMTFAGHESGAKLLGVFGVSVLHNAVHVLFGLAGLFLAKTSAGATQYLTFGGAIYLVLAVYGWTIDPMSSANFVPVDAADNLLHLVLGAAMLLFGIALKPKPAGRY